MRSGGAGGEGEGLELIAAAGSAPHRATEKHKVLMVDDHKDFLGLLRLTMENSGWNVWTATSIEAAGAILAEQLPDAAVLDNLLTDGSGVDLAVEIQQLHPGVHVILMTGGLLSADEETICEQCDIPVLRKPFHAHRSPLRASGPPFTLVRQLRLTALPGRQCAGASRIVPVCSDCRFRTILDRPGGTL